MVDFGWAGFQFRVLFSHTSVLSVPSVVVFVIESLPSIRYADAQEDDGGCCVWVWCSVRGPVGANRPRAGDILAQLEDYAERGDGASEYLDGVEGIGEGGDIEEWVRAWMDGAPGDGAEMGVESGDVEMDVESGGNVAMGGHVLGQEEMKEQERSHSATDLESGPVSSEESTSQSSSGGPLYHPYGGLPPWDFERLLYPVAEQHEEDSVAVTSVMEDEYPRAVSVVDLISRDDEEGVIVIDGDDEEDSSEVSSLAPVENRPLQRLSRRMRGAVLGHRGDVARII